MIHNGTGPATTHVSRERDFEVFDALPPLVRKAMNEAAFKYVAAEVAITVQRFGAEKIAAAMPASDARLIQAEQEREAKRARTAKILRG